MHNLPEILPQLEIPNFNIMKTPNAKHNSVDHTIQKTTTKSLQRVYTCNWIISGVLRLFVVHAWKINVEDYETTVFSSRQKKRHVVIILFESEIQNIGSWHCIVEFSFSFCRKGKQWWSICTTLITRFPKIIKGDADLCFIVLAHLARVLVDFQRTSLAHAVICWLTMPTQTEPHAYT